MKKPVIIYIFAAFALAAVICLALWLFLIFFPFLDRAELLARLGYPLIELVPVSLILEYLFLNSYFILMVAFGIITLILWIIVRITTKRPV